MKLIIIAALICTLSRAEEVRLVDLDPPEAQQYIDKQDTSLKYAPKVESNVPAVRYLGNEPHNVLEDVYLANQYHGQDGLGGYLYGYGVPDIAKTERKQPGGDLRGAYNYISGDGQEIKVEYWDDGTGFHQVDNVPLIQPQQVEDSPDVKAAKEEHLRRWQEEAERNSHPLPNPYDSNGNYAAGVGPQSPPHPSLPRPHADQNVQYYRDHQYNAAPSQNVPQVQRQPPPQLSDQRSPSAGQPLANRPLANQPLVNQPSTRPQFPHQPHQEIPANQRTFEALKSSPSPQLQQRPQYAAQDRAQPVAAQGGAPPQHYQAQASAAVGQRTAALQQDGEDSGEYDPKKYESEDEEAAGPPKGFFYSFEYPVGIIVSKEGGAVQKREGDVHDVYAANKRTFEQQLQGQGRPARSSSGYLYVEQ